MKLIIINDNLNKVIIIDILRKVKGISKVYLTVLNQASFILVQSLLFVSSIFSMFRYNLIGLLVKPIHEFEPIYAIIF